MSTINPPLYASDDADPPRPRWTTSTWSDDEKTKYLQDEGSLNEGLTADDESMFSAEKLREQIKARMQEHMGWSMHWAPRDPRTKPTKTQVMPGVWCYEWHNGKRPMAVMLYDTAVHKAAGLDDNALHFTASPEGKYIPVKRSYEKWFSVWEVEQLNNMSTKATKYQKPMSKKSKKSDKSWWKIWC